MRLSTSEFDKIKNKYGIETLWSWSRLDKARMSKNEYYLTYIKHIPGDRNDCVYAPMGNLCHDTLEKLYSNEIQYEDMIEYFKDNWVALIDISDLRFDRNDSEKNRKIGSKYKENLEHFFVNHDKIAYPVAVERFLLTNFDGIYFQGYADAIYKDDNGVYYIIDFKTSTKYSVSEQVKKSGQLVCYAIGLNQMMNIPFDKIKVAWNFLKYVNVKYEQANGAIASKDIERRDIGIKLTTPVKMWLKKFGYDPDDYIDNMIESNSISVLPQEVQEKFSIHDCYVYVDLDKELIRYWESIVKETVSTIEKLNKAYQSALVSDPERAEEVWMDPIEDVEKESYYYATLSSYSGNLNKSYGRYLDYLEKKKNEADLFYGISNEADNEFDFVDDTVDGGKNEQNPQSNSDSSGDNANTDLSYSKNEQNSTGQDEDDLSWLDLL